MLDNWQRIEKVIKWTGKPSISAFAREIGLNRSENLYQIKRGNNGISKDLAESIATKYPAVSRAWLLTGEGEMLPGSGVKNRYDIPFFKADAAAFATHKAASKPEYYISFPMFRGCEFAAFSLSDAMAPDIDRGAVLFFESTELDALTPGATYLVVSHMFTGIRTVRKDPASTAIRLVATNKEKYDDVVLDLKDVDKLFLVRGMLLNI